MTHDTSRLGPDDYVATIPAEAATEIGDDDARDEALPEGSAIAALFVAALVVVVAALLGVLLLAAHLP